VEIKVFAEDGINKKTYTVVIERAQASQNTDLASLKVNNDFIEIIEDQEDYSYMMEEEQSTYVFYVAGAEPSLQKMEYKIGESGTYTIINHGGSSGSPRFLNKNESVMVYIRVTAENTEISKVYTLTISRKPSTNRNLSLVTVKEGDITKTLTPINEVYTYTLGATGATFIIVNAQGVEGENSIIRILDDSSNEVIDGIIDITDIMPGEYNYYIEVTPQDVSVDSKLYPLNIIKRSSEKMLFEPEIRHSNNYDNPITGITYNPSEYTYRLEIDYELDGVAVTEIRIVLTASVNSIIESPGWADLKQGSPINGQPVSYADHIFTSKVAEYLNRDIIITAEDGSTQTYHIRITRKAADTDNSLMDLTVAGVTVDGFTPEQLIYDTPIILPRDTQTVNVYGEPNSPYATVTYNGSSFGQIPLVVGQLTVVSVAVTAQNDSQRTYIIKVIAANTDNSISDILLLDRDNKIVSGMSFDPDDSGPYNVSVPYTVDAVTIQVQTPVDAFSTVFGAGLKSLSVATNNFKVYAVSEAGVKGMEYTINITRNPARDYNTLNSLTISSASPNPVPNYINNFDPLTTEYSIRVDRNVMSLKVQATVPSDNGSSIVSGLTDNFTWQGTSATIYIVVRAENGDERTYQISVTRANDNNNIIDISVDVQEIAFNPSQHNYLLSPLAFGTDRLVFDVTLEDSYAKLYTKVNDSTEILQNNPAISIVNLSVGENTVKVWAMSEYGTAGDEYIFTVTRNPASENAYLNSLEILAKGENILTGENEFAFNKFSYNVRVNNDVSIIVINAEKQDPNAKITITPETRTLVSGENTFKIYVTAEDNITQKVYEIKIVRANDINDIDNVEIDVQQINFDPDIKIYQLEPLSYSYTKINFNVTLKDSFAKLYVKVNTASYALQANPSNFDVNLIVGANIVKIYAVSEYGTQGEIYEFLVTRNQPSNNANLDDLVIVAGGKNLLTDENTFAPEKTHYEIRVDYNITSITTFTAIAQDSKAEVTITPTSRDLNAGVNTFYIKVKAEDKVSEKEYVVKITRANDINDIDDIDVNVQQINFNPEITEYQLVNLPYSVNKITFSVTLRDILSQLYVRVGSGSATLQTSPDSFDVNLNVGENLIRIYAVSQYGTQGKIYRFSVTRNPASGNAKLGLLEVWAGEVNLLTGENAFSPEKEDYEVRVDRAVNSVSFIALTQDINAKYVIVPSNGSLSLGKNTFYITVTAENNETSKSYQVVIWRANDINDIDDIKVDGNTIYNPATISYELGEVNFAKDKINLQVDLRDAYSKLYVKVNALSEALVNNPSNFDINLTVGQNTIVLYAESEFGTKGQNYTLTITRKPASNDNKLEALSVTDAQGNNLPFDDDIVFNPNVYSYTITLENTSEITEIIINATAQNNNKTLSGDIGQQTLTVNPNGTINSQFKITVTAENGAKQEYIINIIKETSLSSDTSIASVSLLDSSNNNYISFNSNSEKQNDVCLPYAVAGLTLTVVPNDSNAAVSGTKGYIPVAAGGSAYVEFQVIAQDGTEGMVYYFTIYRSSPSAEKYLDSLSVKDINDDETDFLEGLFSGEIKNYSIRVDDIVQRVVITATVPSNNGSRIISELQPYYDLISGGEISVGIIVQAEDGSTCTYTVKIKRANNDNRISAIILNGVTVPIEEFIPIAGSYEYTAPNVTYSVATLEIQVILAGGAASKATVSGDGIKNLQVGNNTFIVYATAQDGTVGNNYIIRIFREAASLDNTLKSLKVTADTQEVLLDVSSNVQNVYNLKTDRSASQIVIDAQKNHIGAQVIGGGAHPLTGGITNVFNIFVTAENGDIKTYTVNIEVKDSDNEIENISTNIAQLNFEKTQEFYDLGELPYTVDQIVFSVELSSAYAKLYINSVYRQTLSDIAFDLAEGENIFIIYAESERGEKGREYTVAVTRTPADDNNYLSSLAALDGENILPFAEGSFNPANQQYTVILTEDSTTFYVEIIAVAQSENAQVEGTGIKQLKAVGGIISNTFTVTVTAQNGSKRDYTITVIKTQDVQQSNDNTIKDISLIGKGTEYLKDIFDPQVSRQQDISVPYSVDSVYLSITAHAKATVMGQGLYNLEEGQTITIEFQVIAENGNAGTLYQVDVTREMACGENTLIELYYESQGERVNLNPETETHTINVDIFVSSIILGGVAPQKAKVSGFGEFQLTASTTIKVITVTAENGDIKTYMITIMKLSDDATIKSIKLYEQEILDSFVDGEYSLTVLYAEQSVTIIATPNNSSATISGNGSFALAVGVNEFVVYAVSEAGTKGEEYRILITRQEPNGNNNLASLIVKDTATDDILILQPAFNPSTTKYTIDITDLPQVSEIEIIPTPESVTSNVTGGGTYILKTQSGESSETFTVTVSAQNGAIKKYEITVIRNVKPEDDVTVHELSLIGSDSVNYLGTAQNARTSFQLNKKYYNLTLPYKVENVTLTVINNNSATVYGNGNYTLKETQETVIEFLLVSQSGKYESDTYVIVINRELPSPDNTLSGLFVDGSLIEGFDPDITEYVLTVSYEEVSSVHIAATATHPQANVIGDLGQINLTAGINTINVTVRAEDNSTRTYSLTIRRLSTDNALLHLGVSGYQIEPAFSASVYNYTLTVPYTAEIVNVVASANEKATIFGAGPMELEVGENSAEVYVVSEQGQQGDIYTLVITRTAPSSDNTLKSLTVLAGGGGQVLPLQPAFKPQITDYIIQLEEDSDIHTIEIFAEANCPLAKGVGGTGYKILTTTVDGKYHNVFEIIVMAQDNSTKIYTVSVYRDVELSDDITIANLSLMGSDGVNYLGNSGNGGLTQFLPDIYSYNIVVPYYVESITLSVSTLTATVYGDGQKVFGSENRTVFEFYLVSQSGNTISNRYTITVNRTLPLEDNTLEYIKVNGEIIQGFDPENTQYEINIPYLSTDKIIISAKPVNATAIILKGTGSFDIVEGRNVFSILVQAESGDTRSYNLVVNYMNNNAFLESLSLIGFVDENENDDDNGVPYPFTFIYDSFNYIITVDKNIKAADVKAAAQDQERAAIIGLGRYPLNDDRTTIVINVIAADNTTTNTYKINIVKTVMPSKNTRLKDLKVDGYSLAFDPNNFSYMLSVGSDTKTLDISAIPEDPAAKATIIGNDYIDIGKNVILVQVEAEDGTVSYYQISVQKSSEPDYFLTVMLILIFLTLLMTFLYRIISANKDKIKKFSLKGFKLKFNNNESAIDLNNIGKEVKKWQT
jgi:hypothetical protein